MKTKFWKSNVSGFDVRGNKRKKNSKPQLIKDKAKAILKIYYQSKCIKIDSTIFNTNSNHKFFLEEPIFKDDIKEFGKMYALNKSCEKNSRIHLYERSLSHFKYKQYMQGGNSKYSNSSKLKKRLTNRKRRALDRYLIHSVRTFTSI